MMIQNPYRALSMPGISFTQDQKDAIQAMIDGGNIEGARRLMLDLLNEAIESDILRGRGDGQPVGLLSLDI